MTLTYRYSHLNTVQKGSFGEAFAKMAFTLEGFEVYSSEYDDRGVDFVVRTTGGKFYSVQVKTFGPTANPFIYASKFQLADDFIFLAIRLIEGEPPAIFMAKGSEWLNPGGCLGANDGGGTAGPYYELRFGAKHADALDAYTFGNYIQRLKAP